MCLDSICDQNPSHRAAAGGSSNLSVFVSSVWTVVCGDEIQLLWTHFNLTASHLIPAVGLLIKPHVLPVSTVVHLQTEWRKYAICGLWPESTSVCRSADPDEMCVTCFFKDLVNRRCYYPKENIVCRFNFFILYFNFFVDFKLFLSLAIELVFYVYFCFTFLNYLYWTHRFALVCCKHQHPHLSTFVNNT